MGQVVEHYYDRREHARLHECVATCAQAIVQNFGSNTRFVSDAIAFYEKQKLKSAKSTETGDTMYAMKSRIPAKLTSNEDCCLNAEDFALLILVCGSDKFMEINGGSINFSYTEECGEWLAQQGAKYFCNNPDYAERFIIHAALAVGRVVMQQDRAQYNDLFAHFFLLMSAGYLQQLKVPMFLRIEVNIRRCLDAVTGLPFSLDPRVGTGGGARTGLGKTAPKSASRMAETTV